MDAERWRKIEQLYHASLEREVSDRSAFPQEARAGDEELRHKVEALLARETALSGRACWPAVAISLAKAPAALLQSNARSLVRPW
jgi:hypothetical protein